MVPNSITSWKKDVFQWRLKGKGEKGWDCIYIYIYIYILLCSLCFGVTSLIFEGLLRSLFYLTFFFVCFLFFTEILDYFMLYYYFLKKTPLYHFHPLHKHLRISQAITTESSPLHRASTSRKMHKRKSIWKYNW